MHELKVARSQALTTREMAQIGLFTALIAAGAYIKINIPVQPFPMHFTMQFLFVLLAGFLLGARRGAICVGIYLAGIRLSIWVLIEVDFSRWLIVMLCRGLRFGGWTLFGRSGAVCMYVAVSISSRGFR